MSSRLRVLMLATYFPKPDNPLMGNWALAQARALAKQDLDLRVISLTSWVPRALALSPGAKAYASCPATFDWNGVVANYPHWLWYPVPPIKRWEYVRPSPFLQVAWKSVKNRLIRFCHQFRPEVVYAHHTAVNGFVAMKLKATCGIPYVITDHDYGEISDCAHLKYRKRFFSPIVGNAYSMVGVSRRMTATLKELFPSARACTVHNGTDPIPDQVLSLPRRAAPDDKIIIFSCGAFYDRKQFPLLIDAFAAIASKYPHVDLRIAGDGVQRPIIERRIEEHHLENRVCLLGFLPHAEVLQEMAWSDIFALVSRDEPFATVYTEALSAGKPIICCSDGGIADVVRDRQEGLIVSPGDRAAAAAALEEVIVDSRLRKSMGEAGKKLFHSELTWNHNASAMAELLSGAARRRKGEMVAIAPIR